MSHIPPPPPMPLKLLHQDSKSRSGFSEENFNKCLCDLSMFAKLTITNIKPIAQCGPNCGLAALAMVSSLIPSQLSIAQIFEEACDRGFTNHGEMFSALNMKILADEILSPWFNVDFFTGGLEANKSNIIDRLFRGDLMLVPYDADHNGSPCCARGHKAHWALVCGVLMGSNDEMFVAARHGKSRYVAIWSFDSLQQSNDNLSELAPSRVTDTNEYLLPPGGVKEGLSSKFILLEEVK